MTVAQLPALNASLNGAAACLLVAGYALVRRRRLRWHRAAMLSALGCSVAFLASYLYYHAQVGSRPYEGLGWRRSVYFTILISHTTLAATVPFLAVVTAARGLRGRHPQHARLARWTLPVWLYVSVTGVVIYLMLYRPWHQ